MDNKKRCTNCDRFPFCVYQGICETYNNTVEKNMSEKDYWVKRANKMEEI